MRAPSAPDPANPPIVVLKIGGSVLTGLPAYFTAASFVARRLDELRRGRILAVVSAEHGHTDALLSTARALGGTPDPASLDLLWSTGELRSVALLALALRALGVRAAAANVHQTGLTRHGSAAGVHLNPLPVNALLSSHDVVVVPGFLARGDDDSIVSLGRGGSDLTAVVLAVGLAATTCELVKDVDGYYSSDPNLDSAAEHLPVLSFDRALALADAGCRLVQRDAIAAARAAGVPLVVRSVTGRRSTTVAADHAVEHAEPSHPPVSLLLSRS